jgi:gliding motility-associated protein GldC
MAKSNIVIDVELDASKIPQSIHWDASDGSGRPQEAKAMILSLWDGADKAALRIDLWTQKMMVDEMADFYYQTLMTMADTFERATKQTELVSEMKNFARQFHEKFTEVQLQTNKAG